MKKKTEESASTREYLYFSPLHLGMILFMPETNFYTRERGPESQTPIIEPPNPNQPTMTQIDQDSLKKALKLIKMNWDEEETMKFIKMVADHPVLYDPTVTNFTNTLLKESIWEGLAQKLNKSTQEVKKSWRNLKDGFVRFKRKKRGNVEMSDKLNMRIYNVLSFLDSVIDESTRSSKYEAAKAKVQKEIVTSENPFVVGVEHVIFDRPVEVCRSSHSDSQNFISNGRKQSPWQNIIKPGQNVVVANLIKNKASFVDKQKHPVKRPTRVVMSDSDCEEVEDDLIIPIPPCKVLRKYSSNKLNNNKNEDSNTTNNGNVDACNVIISNSNADMANSTNVAHIEVLDFIDHDNVVLSLGEEDNRATKLDTFTRHIQQALIKLPQPLKTQAKEEMFQILTKYESSALEIDKDNQPHNSSSEKITSEIQLDTCTVSMETEIKVESNLTGDNIIILKEAAVPNETKS